MISSYAFWLLMCINPTHFSHWCVSPFTCDEFSSSMCVFVCTLVLCVGGWVYLWVIQCSKQQFITRWLVVVVVAPLSSTTFCFIWLFLNQICLLKEDFWHHVTFYSLNSQWTLINIMRCYSDKCSIQEHCALKIIHNKHFFAFFMYVFGILSDILTQIS